MSALDEDPGTFMQINDIRQLLPRQLPLELKDLKVIPLWNSNIGTGGNRNTVVLAESVKHFSSMAIKGIVVHEAAHIYQQIVSEALSPGENVEEGADRLACEWGFRDELLRFRDEHDALYNQNPAEWREKITRPRPRP